MEDSIVDLLVPDNGKIVKDPETGVYGMTIADRDMDAFECTLIGDGSIEIDTRGSEWISLDVPTLKRMITAINRTESLYKKEDMKNPL